jgi:hypothetical protein
MTLKSNGNLGHSHHRNETLVSDRRPQNLKVRTHLRAGPADVFLKIEAVDIGSGGGLAIRKP